MNTETRGFMMNTRGNSLLAQFADYEAMEQCGGFSDAMMGPDGCHLRFNDPFDYIREKIRELMFRKALADAQGNSTAMQTMTVDVLRSTNVYHTHFGILSIAVALTFLTTCVVSTTFRGYWVLGRDVSMSPVEIAKAFNAPLLRDLDSNTGAKHIVRAAGHKDVIYGIVTTKSQLCLRKPDGEPRMDIRILGS